MDLPSCMYDYRSSPKKAKKVAECTECGTDLYEGDEVYVVANNIYCDDCVRLVTLDGSDRE